MNLKNVLTVKLVTKAKKPECVIPAKGKPIEAADGWMWSRAGFGSWE